MANQRRLSEIYVVGSRLVLLGLHRRKVLVSKVLAVRTIILDLINHAEFKLPRERRLFLKWLNFDSNFVIIISTLFLFSQDSEPTRHELIKLAIDIANASRASSR